MKSLRAQLALFWFLLAVVCVAIGMQMWLMYRLSAGAQIDAARSQALTSCRSIEARYTKSLPVPAPGAPMLDLLNVLLHLVLIEAPHVEGGVWSAQGGFLAYAYPTYEGSSVKHDVPQAEQAHIAEVAALAARTQVHQTDVVRASREALIVCACPLASRANDLVAWTMTRTPTSPLQAQDSLRTGLFVLLGLVLVSGLWLGMLLSRGYRHVRTLERQLDDEDAGREEAPIDATGVAELDRLVAAMNRMRTRARTASDRLMQIERGHARDERLTALGRMIGGIAHEIRNPIAAMRLKAENALASPAADQARALNVIVGQVERLDALVRNLLAVVQPLDLHPQPLALAAWLPPHVSALGTELDARGLHCRLRADEITVLADPMHLGRAVDNLLGNALHHARREITLTALRDDADRVLILVGDDGPGVAHDMRAHLFEPFATDRRDGTGLGLMLAREVALAHGGDLRYVDRPEGACFEIELPWRES